jgi:hypothetical protein
MRRLSAALGLLCCITATVRIARPAGASAQNAPLHLAA